ncbi:exodeoxyribonuclease V subunit alpha [Gemmatimonas sp.]
MMNTTTHTHGAPAEEHAAIDRAFARFVARGVPDPLTTLVQQSALLVSIERAQGNSCVDLVAHAEQTGPDSTVAFMFPPLEQWRSALLASGQCRAADAVGVDDLEIARTPLVLHGNRLYLHRFFAAEQRLSQALRARLAMDTATAASLDASAPLFRQLFPQAANRVDWQAAAAVAALRSSLVFVTGGPGTGKTTVAARLLALLLDRDPTLDIAVAAPTGRAAARLTEAIGAAVQREQLERVVGAHLPSSGTTLHRLLGYAPWNEQFRFHAGHQLPHDVVIVDEASMVDLLMMDALFAAVRPTARIIMLGDPDQLASVDTGFVLGDIVRAARAAGGANPEQHSTRLAADYARLTGGSSALLDAQPHAGALRDALVRLRVSYRFGARPGIGQLAAATQAGDANAVLAALSDAAYPDVTLRSWSGERVAGGSWARRAELLLGPLQSQVDQFLSATEPDAALVALTRFRVLCALRDGETGVTGLNALIEQWLDSRGVRTDGWYDHRPVLITANDAGLQLFNGDVGVTLAVQGVPMVHFPRPDGGVRSLAPSRLTAHETAWAMTVHKAQGSEFDHVQLVLPLSDSRLLTRELLYTGITRAKESVSVLGTLDIIRLATQRTVARASGLVDHLSRSTA